jgi:hypothetical protein
MRVPIVMIHKLFDFGDKVFNTLKGSTANGPLGDKIKPNFNLIEP